MNPRTLDDLCEEVRRGRTPPYEAWEKARVYERSLFPADTRWPSKGEVHECLKECRVSFLTHWHTAFTGGGDAVLRAGECIRVLELMDEKPIIVPAEPLNPGSVEERAVAAHDRNHPNYAGFSLSIRTRDLLAHFRFQKS
jgi:hypothetical protein